MTSYQGHIHLFKKAPPLCWIMQRHNSITRWVTLCSYPLYHQAKWSLRHDHANEQCTPNQRRLSPSRISTTIFRPGRTDADYLIMVRKINTSIWECEILLVLIHHFHGTTRVYGAIALSRVMQVRANDCFIGGMETIAPSTEFIMWHIIEIQIIYLSCVDW